MINTQFLNNLCNNTVSIMVAGSIRRSTLPTPQFVALSAIMALASTTATYGFKWLAIKNIRLTKDFSKIKKESDRALELNKREKALNNATYVFGQAASIFMTYLAVQGIARIGYSIVYDMNRPGVSAYDLGSLFCIAGQSTLVNLFARAMKDLYDTSKA